MGAEDSLVVIRRGLVVVLQVFGLRGRGRGRGLVVALERGLVVALPLFGVRGRGRCRCGDLVVALRRDLVVAVQLFVLALPRVLQANIPAHPPMGVCMADVDRGLGRGIE